MSEYVHQPVLAEEVLDALVIPLDVPALMIDCTTGEGGHTGMMLERHPNLTVIGLDRDEAIQKKARTRLESYGGRFIPTLTWFDDFLTTYEGTAPDAILFDLGISMFHYVESGRGFSFQKPEPLDMRLDAQDAISVADIVNTYEERRLADIIYAYGEERHSRKIAAAICRARAEERLTYSDRLAELIKSAVPPAYRFGRIHPATKTFQALRIEVNHELDRIKPAIEAALKIIRPGGRIAVITFHSLEDRKVKWIFKEAAWDTEETREKKTASTFPPFAIITKKPIVPSEDECRRNPAARSAKLRVIEKAGDYENG
ncbi:16S rRNA (cytosine(1402)-N(4))-methyltransferase RsmH [Parasphaerochaeta coccoides]|uniref:Ribosomal RNA small subunit methyltransferase H n=1 Tax=Parasphaerochaeta coccoides (strain ATCC BAA-1237 / DSM 17374 / SPN1) TaxID=760011 RepID=F4GKX0_PARC1|nr:16S rRNA (cytosine(1402)-N(4))-methyltransferase RsmH [Parasphaerochaeta coccoides]AEC01883.1 Ribosomal RNA small subunit methyltransferase H [Parasphaerochaeta coccoides DSM 17374]